MHFLLAEIVKELFRTLKINELRKDNSKIINAAVFSEALLNNFNSFD